MKLSNKTVLFFLIPLAWLFLAVLLFVTANRVSYLHLYGFPGYSKFLEQIARVSFIKYVLDIIFSLFGVLLFSLASLSLGSIILSGLNRSQSSTLVLGCTAFLVGEILFSLIFLSLIQLYGLSPLLSGGILVAGFIFGFPSFRKYLSYSTLNFSWKIEFGKGEKSILLFVVWIIGSGLLLSSARLGYDASAEYFSHMKIMAASHSPIYFYPKNTVIVSSFHPGILFTPLIQLFGDQSARMLPWVNGVVILFLGYEIGRIVGLSFRARLIFLVLMGTSTVFLDLLGDGKVEMISTAPTLAAVFWMLQNTESKLKNEYLLIGLFSGFSIISRPYNIFLVSLFVFLFYFGIFLQNYFKSDDGTLINLRNMLSVFWVFPTLIFLGIFHLWQNWLWLGTPLAPLVYARETDVSAWQWQHDPELLNTFRLLYVFVATFFNTPQSLGNISPLFVGFLSFGALSQIRKQLIYSTRLRLVTWISVIVLLAWVILFFTIVEVRYVLFLWILLFISISVLIEITISSLNRPYFGLVNLLCISLLFFVGVRMWVIALGSYSPVEKNGKADCYDLDICTFFDVVNKLAAPGDRVLVLNAYRYYLRPDLFLCSSRVEEYAIFEPLAHQSPIDFWEAVYQQGYRFIVFEKHLAESRYRFGAIPSLRTLPHWLRATELNSINDDSEFVYRLDAVNPPVLQNKACRLNGNGIWDVISISSQ